MKNFYLVLALCLLSLHGFSATWYSRPGGGNAATLTNWWSTPGGTGSNPTIVNQLLTPGDIWVFQSAMTSTASLTISGSVSFIAGGSFTPSAGSTFSVGANWSNTGGVFTANSSTVAMTSTSAGMTLSGAMTGTNKFFNLTFSGSGSWSFGSSSVEIGGTLAISNGTLTTSTGTTTVTGSVSKTGGTISGSGGTINVSGNWSNTGGNVTFTTEVIGVTGTWTHSSGTYVAGSGTLTIGSNFTNSATMTNTSGTINVAGSWSNTGTFTAGTGTVAMTSTATGRTLSGTMTGASKFNNLTFSGSGGGWSFGSTSVDIGGTLSISNGTVTWSTGTTTVTGSVNKTGGTISGTSGTTNVSGNWSNNGGNITFTTNVVTVTGTWSHSAGTYVTGTGTLTVGSNFSNSATMTNTSGTINVGGSWINTGTFTAGLGTVVMNSSVTGRTISGTLTNTTGRFNNLTFNNASGGWTFLSSADVFANFTITSGNITAPSATLQVGGNWSNSGTFNHNSGTVVMNSSSTGRTLTGSMTGANRFNHLTFNGSGGTWSFAGNAADVNGNFTTTLGTVTSPTSTLNISGNYNQGGGTYTSGSGGQLNITGSFAKTSGTFTAGTSTIRVGGNWSNSSTFTANTSTVIMNATSTGRTMSGTLSGTSGRFNILQFNGVGGGWTISNTLHTLSNFTITNGAVNANANIQVGGSWSNSGSFNANSNTVTMSSTSSGLTLSGSMTGANRFYNLTFTSSGAWSFGANTAEVAGNFQINNGTVTAPSTTLTIGLDYINNRNFRHNNGTVIMTGNSGYNYIYGSMTGSNAFNHLTFNGSGSTFDFNYYYSADIAGNFTISNSRVVAPGSGYNLQVNGNWTNNGSFYHNYSAVIMGGAGIGKVISGNMSGSDAFYNLRFNGAGSWVFGPGYVDVNNNFVINNGTVTAPGSSYMLQVWNNWTNRGTFNHNNGYVLLNGFSEQALTGVTGFYDLELNNSSGALLIDDQSVAGTLTLSSGVINVDTLNFTFKAGASPVAGSLSTSSMLTQRGKGEVRKEFSSNGSFLLPVGDSIYSPITLNFTGGTYNPGGYAGVKVKKLKHPNNANVTDYLKRYWSVNISGITSPVYSADAAYLSFDVVGNESNISAGAYPSAKPWSKFGGVNVGTHEFSSGSVSAIATDFTGITSTNPSLTINNDTTMCLGDSLIFNTSTFYADPLPLFTWSPATSLSSTFGFATIFKPVVTGTYIYTVTLTDGNGFTANRSVRVVVNSYPSPISGITTVCTGETTTLTSTPGSGKWYSGNTFLATADSMTGVVEGLFMGNPVITYMLPTGCGVTATTTVLPSPPANIGSSNICVGGSTTLFNPISGGAWSSSNIAIAAMGSVAGAVDGIASGISDIIYTAPNGCKAITAIVVNDSPSVYNVTGGGGYCAGTPGSSVGLSSSDLGVNYYLYRGGMLIGNMPGTGSVLDFGLQPVAGTYTVKAINPAGGCSSIMSGNATVFVNTLPTSYHQTNDTGYCAETAGVEMILDGSDAGATYQLYYNGAPIWVPFSGSGSAINMGYITEPGSYVVVATDGTTGCTNMMDTTNVSIYPLPLAYDVIGGGHYCAGGIGLHVGVAYSTPGVNYQLQLNGSDIGTSVAGSGTPLDFGLQSLAGSYTVVANNNVTACSSPMNGNTVVFVDTLPAVYDITGTYSYCAGDSGVHISLNSSDLDVNYQVYRGVVAVGSPVAGTGSLLDLGLQTMPGNYTVIAANAYAGCISNMSGMAAVSVSPLPIVYTLSAGSGSYCAGDAGLNIVLSGSQIGVSYQLYHLSSPVGLAKSGTGSALDFGLHTLTGNYKVVATFTATGCMSTSNTVTISLNTLPTVYNTTGGGAFCSGSTGVHVGLDFSSVGVNYQLFHGLTPVGASVPGANTSIDFGIFTTGGTYTILAFNATSGCSIKMQDSAVVTVSPAPVAYILAASGSSYCAGSPGIQLLLSGSDINIEYQLLQGGLPFGAPVPGSGTSLDFGFVTIPGMYSVIATDPVSACSTTMSGSAPVVVTPLPTVYTVTGGGAYCSGDSGVHVGVSGSAIGINYHLYNNGIPTGTIVAGSGSSLDFGFQSAPGLYTVVAKNPLATCASDMFGNAMIFVKPAPAAHPVTGGGTYCAGGVGHHIAVSATDAGVDYQLYHNGGPIMSPQAGAGPAIDFGIQSLAGIYDVIATDISSGCRANIGSATIVVNALPDVDTVYGGGSYCLGDTIGHIWLMGSLEDVNYSLYNNGIATGTVVSGNGTVLDLGLHLSSGNYTILATSATTGCSTVMYDSAHVLAHPLPVTYSVTGGGSYCPGTSGVHIGLAHSDWGISYQLSHSGSPVGAPVSGAGIPLDFGIIGSAGSYDVVATNTVTGCKNNMNGIATVSVAPPVAPSVSITTVSGDDTLCAGAVAHLVATPVNGGTAPSYEWRVNGSLVGSASTYSYVPVNGDLITATMVSNAACALPVVTVSNSVVLTVRPFVSPAVSISATPGNEVCTGTSVTLTANSSEGGSAPMYWWVKNSVVVATGTTYYTTPTDGDIYIMMMKSNYPCRTRDTVFSNNIPFIVDVPVAPSVAIEAYPGTTVAPGDRVVLTAKATNAGRNPAYHWYVNGEPVTNAVTEEFETYSFADNDSVSCIVTTGGACATVYSFNSLFMQVKPLGVKQLLAAGSDIRLVPNPNKGSFSVKGKLGTLNDAELDYEVTNMLGQVVYAHKAKVSNGIIDQQIDLGTNLSNGMYILNVQAGAEKSTFHFVVSK